jgi:carboxypeptidase C (cathepsin A)
MQMIRFDQRGTISPQPTRWFRFYLIQMIIALLPTFTTTTAVAALVTPNHPQHHEANPSDTTNTQTKTSNDYLVHDLETIEPSFQHYDGAMYAGLISTATSGTNDNGELMFWLYEPTNPTYTDTLLIWFNGGPGCSSCTLLLPAYGTMLYVYI